MENRSVTDIRMDANLPRNWLRTIEKESPPFVARNPLTADIKPKSFAQEVAERQAIILGSQYLGRGLQVLGASMITAGSTTRPSGTSSVLMRRDTTGKRQEFRYTHDGVKHDRPAPSRSNRWYGYETKHSSKAGTNLPSSRTTQRSPTLVNAGLVVTVAGRVVPGMALIYAYYRYFGDPSKTPAEEFTDDYKFQYEMTDSIIRDSATAIYSNPVIRFATKVSLANYVFS